MDFSSLIILGNALVLGIRHGIDWDHIAAIADIVGTVSNTKINHAGTATLPHRSALRLSSFYAVGHATIVLILGLLALLFSTVLPEWIDPLMEKAVGATLIVLGLWIFFSLFRRTHSQEEFVLQSRWMFILSKLQDSSNAFTSRLTGSDKTTDSTANRYNAPAAFGVGLIHGFGAETGTQVLLIATVGGSSHVLGTMILLSFITGLLISNTLVAMLTCAGFASSTKFNALFSATSVLTGLFSLIVGLLFITGYANLLPDIHL